METNYEFDHQGIANLICALISDARKKYVKSVASNAWSAKQSVDEWYRDHKVLVHKWEWSRFVIKDPYGIFAEWGADGIFKTWNDEAQKILDQKNHRKKHS